MNTIVNTFDGVYRMSVIFDKTTNTYILIFASVKDNKGQQYTCKSYADAVNRFQANCRFYGVKHPVHIPTEQEFLGIPDGVWPTSNNRATRKEVTYAKNRA